MTWWKQEWNKGRGKKRNTGEKKHKTGRLESGNSDISKNKRKNNKTREHQEVKSTGRSGKEEQKKMDTRIQKHK